MGILAKAGASITGVVVALDRQEIAKKGGELSAVELLNQQLKVPIINIVVSRTSLNVFDQTRILNSFNICLRWRHTHVIMEQKLHYRMSLVVVFCRYLRLHA